MRIFGPVLTPNQSRRTAAGLSAILGLGAVVLGASVLLSWALQAPAAVRLFAQSAPVHPNSAAAFILCGVAVLGLAFARRRWTAGAGIAVGLIGAASGVRYLFGVDAGIDALLAGPLGYADPQSLGRMPSVAAAGFALLGIAFTAVGLVRSPRTTFLMLAMLGLMLLILAAGAHLASAVGLGIVSWRSVIEGATNTLIGIDLIVGALIVHGWSACRMTSEPLPHWSAWLAGAGVAALSVLFWQTLHQREHLNEQRILQAEVNELKEAFIDRIIMRIAPLMRMKARLEREGGLPQDAWKAMTAALFQEHPGYSAIIRIDRDYGYERIEVRPGRALSAGLSSPASTIDHAVLQEARETGNLFLTEPMRITGEAPEFLMLNPVYINDKFDGFIGASFGYEPLFHGLIEKSATKGIAISFWHGSLEALTAAASGLSAGIGAELPFPLMTQTFTVTARPLDAAATNPGLPELVLAAGFAVGMLLVITLGAERKARLQLAASERQHRETFENAPVPMSWVGPDGRFMKTNGAYRALLGFDAAELEQMGPVDLVHPSERMRAENAIRAMLDGALDRIAVDVKHIHKHGRPVWAHVTIAAMRGFDGRPNFLLAHLQDITARKMAEEHLFQSQKMEALGNLAGGIAHDFNNMLLPIIALTELSLNELADDHPARENLAAVLEAAAQASRLVEQILTFSRQNEQLVERIDITQCVLEASRLLRNVIPSSITVRDALSTDVGVVLGDRAQLVSLIMNLGSNANDAMAGKVGTLSLRLERALVGAELAARMPALLEGAAYAKLEVEDSGCGMDRDTMEKIFNPFFTTKPVGEGTGLGLAMVHGIVQGLGGAIDVASEVGVGTTFTIYLPLQAEGAQAAQIPARDMAAA